MITRRELEQVVAQVNVVIERLNKRIEALENGREEEGLSPRKGRGKRVQQAEADSKSSN